MSTRDDDVIQGVSLAQYASVNAALTHGLGFEAALGAYGIAPQVWSDVEEQWQERIDEDLAGEGLLLEAYDAHFIAASDGYARRVPPLDEDVSDWLHFLRILTNQPEPLAFLTGLHLEPRDLLRIHRLWSKRFEMDPALRERAFAVMQEEPRDVLVPRPAPQANLSGAAPDPMLAADDDELREIPPAQPPPLFAALPGRAPVAAPAKQPVPSPSRPPEPPVASFRFGADASVPVPQIFQPIAQVPVAPPRLPPSQMSDPVAPPAPAPVPVVQSTVLLQDVPKPVREERAPVFAPGGTLVLSDAPVAKPAPPATVGVDLDQAAFTAFPPPTSNTPEEEVVFGLTLEQHASMSAELLVFGRKHTYAKYGLEDKVAREALEAAWSARLQGNPNEYERWQQLYMRALEQLGVG